MDFQSSLRKRAMTLKNEIVKIWINSQLKDNNDLSSFWKIETLG